MNNLRISNNIKKTNEIIEVSALSLHKLANDPRPHACVNILGENVIGLMDSGASCTVLGKDSRKLIEKLGLKIHQTAITLKTADGAKHDVYGCVDLPFTFNRMSKMLRTLIVPSISKELILGIDFWNKFEVTPSVARNEMCYALDEFNTEHVLTLEEKNDLLAAIATLPSPIAGKMTRTTCWEHDIDTGESQPVRIRPYVYSPKREAALNKELDRMLIMGVIVPSISPWCHGLAVVEKPNGSLRVCLDSRKLNLVTKRDVYPLPNMNRIFGRLRKTKYLSSIDLKEAFWQIPLSTRSREKTAFSVPGRGHFEFISMPFGLVNAAQSQSRLMDRVLGYDLEPCVYVYLDDIIVATDSIEQHVKLIREISLRLRNAGLTVNIEKSKFCQKSIKYLGYIISEEGVSMDRERLTPILNMPSPTNKKAVRRLIGMTGWYRKFIKNFSSLTAPITDCIKDKKKKFEWTQAADKAFGELKLALISAPVLRNPDFGLPWTLQCDASDIGVGAVLSQNDADGEHAVAYFSMKLTDCQKNYTVSERECLAVVLACEKFRGYIEGFPVKVITDHASLLWLGNIKDMNGRLARWALKLQQYDLEFEHRKGKLHVVPDALSRDIASVELCLLDQDDWYERLKSRVLRNPELFPDFKCENDILYKHFLNGIDHQWNLIVPEMMKKRILEENHDSCAHLGVFKTISRIKERYYWPKMFEEVKKYVNDCDVCKAAKTSNVRLTPQMGRMKFARQPWQMISIDFFGPVTRSRAGFACCLVIIDCFSKYVLICPLREATAKATCNYLENEVFLKFGVPQKIYSDNGRQFVSGLFKDLLEKYDVEHRLNAVHHPQVNPVERVMKTIGATLRASLKEDQTKWSDSVPRIAYAINSARHESTGYSPFHINFGRNMIINGKDYVNLPFCDLDLYDRDDYLKDVRQRVRMNLLKAYKRYAKYYNQRNKVNDNNNVRQFKDGDIVWRRNFSLSDKLRKYTAKLGQKWIKCRIIKVIGRSSYSVKDMNGNYVGTYHQKDLKAN